VLILNGDVPLMRAELLSALLDARRLDQAALALVAVDAIDPTALGRVVRNEGGTVERIVELEPETRRLREFAGGFGEYERMRAAARRAEEAAW